MQAFAIPLLVSVMCGYFLVNNQNGRKPSAGCEAPSEKSNLERNQLASRVKILINQSNDPCEDRFNCYQFKNLDGYYSAVFDGHAGWQVAEMLMKNMHLYIDEELKKCWSKGEKEITQSIINGFKRAEDEWTKIAEVAFHNGFPKAGYAGSCALVAVVHENKVYVANAGDSKGVLLRKKGDGYERIKVSKTFNANKKYE